MGAGVWAQRLGLAAAACVTLAILGFYASRLLMPLPIFAADEAAYLIRALYPDDMVAKYPDVVALTNGVHLSVIRAVYEIGAPYIIGDRLVNAAAYLGGLLWLWRASAARLARADQAVLLLIAVGFPYYGFAFSNMAEGLFVGVLVLLCLATRRWYRARPIVHALVGGALAAALVLVKPHGLAAVVALAIVAVADAAVSRGWRRLPVRALLFAVAFFVVGNLIQIGADEPAAHPLTFFIGGFYDGQLAARTPPSTIRLGLLELGAMASSMALLAGPAILIGLCDLIGRWRARRPHFQADGANLVFLLLVVSLAGTLAMVAVFAMKVASTISETYRLWGRYFEFFVPLLWLAAGSALARPPSRRVAWACCAVVLIGLAGLLLSFHAGFVLFPWDCTILLAFFHPDPVRVPLGFPTPYRAIAVAATLLAGAALALRARPAWVGMALVLALGALSSHLDHAWLGPLVRQRYALERDIQTILPTIASEAGEIVLLAPDANDGHLGFLRLGARPRVLLGPPAKTPPAELAGAQVVVVSGPDTPPGGPWGRTFKGEALSVFRSAPATLETVR
jgi:hypothetical protein